MKLSPAVFAFALFAPVAAFAGAPADLVKSFYPPIVSESDVSLRDHYTDPAKTKLDQNDVQEAANDVGCIDFGLSVDAQDFDEDSISRTLKLDETVTGDEAKVIASFRLFANDSVDRKIEWNLKKVGGDWKVSDIASPESNWRLSEFDCTEGAGAQ